MRNAFASIVSGMASLFVMSSVASADCGEVTITEMNWASSQVVTSVAKFIMEQGYGCSVKKIPSATTTAIASLSETGQPDIVTELWVNSTPIYDKLADEGKVKTATDVLLNGGIQGWWIPKYLADEHPELKTIEDIINNPALVGGKFHNCPVGWACRKVNDSLIRALKLNKAMKIFNHGSGETLAASIASAYADKKPWFGYYWAPTAVLGKYPMVEISLAPYNAKIHDCNAKGKDCTAPGVSNYPKGKVITAVTTDMALKNPDVFEFMSKLAFTNAQMGEVLSWQEDNKASSDEAAVYFLTKYKKIWVDWLNKDAKKKLAALLD